jgi:NADPH:quinone reductase-like Zn-dependent oxidoreductase
MVRRIGADRVIDYTRQDFTKRPERYDLILDNVGNHSLLTLRRVLAPNGTIVIVGGDKSDPWLGPLWRWIHAAMLQPFVDERLVSYIADMNAKDLAFLAQLSSEGKLTPVIDREYTLEQVPAALEYLGQRHASGKVVIKMD